MPLILCAAFFHRQGIETFPKNLDNQTCWIIPKPSSIRLISLGFDNLAADLLWLQFILYVGDVQAREVDGAPLTESMARSIIAANPHFVQVYWFATFLIGGEQHNPEKADDILQHGIQENADNWYLPFIAGFNEYVYGNNEEKAAKYYLMAAKFPNAPQWLSRQATILEARIPSEIKRARVWQSVYDTADSTAVRERARQNLVVIWLRIWKRAPNPNIRSTAAAQLSQLGLLVRANKEGKCELMVKPPDRIVK